jgi:hypothetical protein
MMLLNERVRMKKVRYRHFECRHDDDDEKRIE